MPKNRRLALVAVLVSVFVVIFITNRGRRVEPADLVLTNGQVVTVDEKVPEAQAVAVRGDKIAAVGSVKDIRRYIGPETRVIDLEGN
ncbi:MAG: amidohydrolase, partial [Candidatus Aminicenantes bacterium]|nr:amidohydrolase [Candidatus Aminicenantes bacterium]